jgi:hypothetical protein
MDLDGLIKVESSHGFNAGNVPKPRDFEKKEI